MAQLSTDTAAFGGALLTLDEALAGFRAQVTPMTGSETVALMAAHGRILDQDLRASIHVPAFDNSAVDGYAVRHADLSPDGTTRVPVSARVAAGRAATHPIDPGTAIRIFTGAPMPAGADTVFMQEDVSLEDGVVLLPQGLKRGANLRKAGEDFRAGTIVLKAGERLSPMCIASAASLGVEELVVRCQIRVALFSTGDEIIAPGEPLRPGAQYDSNRALLAAMLTRRGAVISDLGILPDNPELIRAALAAAGHTHDLILTSGGVSTGEEDHVKGVVESLGNLSFWRLAIKPGRPVAMGRIHGATFVGLPGNPVAAFVTFVRFAGPLVDHLAGGTMRSPEGFPVKADFHYAKKAGRREYVRASLGWDGSGGMIARKFPREGAALLSSLIGTGGLVELSEATTDVTPGDLVPFLPYDVLI